MKIRRLVVLSVLLCPCFAVAQRPDVRKELAKDHMLSSGLDAVYNFETPAPPAAPEGYGVFYVSHYGRHGSRFPYTASAYKTLLEMLREASASGNLTDYGRQMLDGLEPLWEKSCHRVGDLTMLGWDQHRRIARLMVGNFPAAFTPGSRIDACSSSSPRAMMSMSSFCLSLAQQNAGLDIYEHQGLMETQATAPNMGRNPLRLKGPDFTLPYHESEEEFFMRLFPDSEVVLARMFLDPAAALGSRTAFSVFDDIYMLVAGMNSLPDDYRMDLEGIFTDEEFARMWECDNYRRLCEYYAYRTSCCSVYDDIISKADARIAAGKTGADLRFGHDHVLMSLMLIADIEGFAELPASSDRLAEHFQTFRSPMAANLQFVFYRPLSGDGPVLFRLLLNGEPVRIGDLSPDEDGCFAWEDFKTYFARIRSGLVGEPTER